MKDSTVQSVCGRLASAVPDKTTGNFHRPDYADFFDGSGIFLSEPAENAGWSAGFARKKIAPSVAMGDVYISGSDGNKRKLKDVPTPQYIRTVAVSDGSGRGVHVFSSLDCAGLSYADVKQIRRALFDAAEASDLRSINICATGAPGGADTLGLWGNLPKAALHNFFAVRSKKTAKNAVSGQNADFMEYLRFAAARCIRESLLAMRPGTLFCGRTAEGTFLRFTPSEGGNDIYVSVKNGALQLADLRLRGYPADDTPVEPLLNVLLTPLLIPADNRAILLAAKLKLIAQPMIKVSVNDDLPPEYHYPAETGIVQLGRDLYAALIPTDGAAFATENVASLLPGISVIGLANGTLGAEHLKHTLNGFSASLPTDAGKRTQTELNGALTRTAQKLIKERHTQNV